MAEADTLTDHAELRAAEGAVSRLYERQAETLAALNDVKVRIAMYAELKEKGERVSRREWLAALETKRVLGLRHQQLLTETATLKESARRIRVECENSSWGERLQRQAFERQFLELAREMLPKDTYMTICREANRRYPRHMADSASALGVTGNAGGFRLRGDEAARTNPTPPEGRMTP